LLTGFVEIIQGRIMSRTNIIIIISSTATLLFVLELVRRRKLREEYSWLWLLTAVVYLVVTIWSGLGDWVTDAIGTNSVPIAFAFIGLQFLVIISIQYSVRLSNLTTQIKDLSQEVAILDSELRQLQGENEKETNEEFLQLIQQNELLSQKIMTLERELDEFKDFSTDDT
jgi:hypothetical protein